MECENTDTEKNVEMEGTGNGNIQCGNRNLTKVLKMEIYNVEMEI